MTARGKTRTGRHGGARLARALSALLLFGPALSAGPAGALEVPARPRDRVSDYAGALSFPDQATLNRELAAFERKTSNQVVVAIFPSLEGENPAEFSIRLFNRWKLGRRGRDNGVLLVLFLAERSSRLVVGTGLEKAMPESLCARILAEDLAPLLGQGRTALGIVRTVESIERATEEAFPGGPYPLGPPWYRRLTTEDAWPFGALGLAVIGALLVIVLAREPAGNPGRRHRRSHRRIADPNWVRRQMPGVPGAKSWWQAIIYPAGRWLGTGSGVPGIQPPRDLPPGPPTSASGRGGEGPFRGGGGHSQGGGSEGGW